MFVLGIDVETTGLDSEVDFVIEIGAVLWDVEKKIPVKIFSEMILEKKDMVVSKEIAQLTGIDTETLQAFGVPATSRLFKDLDWMCERADYFVAHNAPFDKGFMTKFYERNAEVFPDKPWIDTVQDVPYPKHIKQKNLIYLSAVHGFVNPFSHRAVTDVLSMLKLLANYDMQKIAISAQATTLEIIAKVSFAEKDLAKDAGFRWKPETKQWFIQIKEPDFDKDNYPFEIEVKEL
ncbi:MAG: exonuclease domain-containing protein [SAR324 cluster bacterium]|nr:exonuclease domain-containing protein [SAR324 cluster bacterium]